MPFYLARVMGGSSAFLNNSIHLSHGLVELVGAAGEDREGVGRGVEGAERGEEFAGFEVFYGGECLAETVFGKGAASLVGEVQAAADEDGGEEAAEHVLSVEAPAGFEGKFLDARTTEDIVVFPEGSRARSCGGVSVETLSLMKEATSYRPEPMPLTCQSMTAKSSDPSVPKNMLSRRKSPWPKREGLGGDVGHVVSDSGAVGLGKAAHVLGEVVAKILEGGDKAAQIGQLDQRPVLGVEGIVQAGDRGPVHLVPV